MREQERWLLDPGWDKEQRVLVLVTILRPLRRLSERFVHACGRRGGTLKKREHRAAQRDEGTARLRHAPISAGSRAVVKGPDAERASPLFIATEGGVACTGGGSLPQRGRVG
jgi:hypothetical protein